MTAGSGLLHSEVSSENFKKNGGEEEILQLWMNLSSKHKMVKPNYVGLNQKDIPHISVADGKGFVELISSNYGAHHGPVNSLSKLTMTSIRLQENANLNIEIPDGNEVFFYVVIGKLIVNKSLVDWRKLIQFENADGDISIQTQSETFRAGKMGSWR